MFVSSSKASVCSEILTLLPPLLHARSVCCGFSLCLLGRELFSHHDDTSHTDIVLTQTQSSLFIYIASASSNESKNKKLALSKQIARPPSLWDCCDVTFFFVLQEAGDSAREMPCCGARRLGEEGSWADCWLQQSCWCWQAPPPTCGEALWHRESSHSLIAMGSSSNRAPKLTEKRTFQWRMMSVREKQRGGSEQGSLTSAKRVCNLPSVIIKVAAINWQCKHLASLSSALKCLGKPGGWEEPLIMLYFALQKVGLNWPSYVEVWWGATET